MPKINVLPKDIAELIAAGEVVDRPSSVVKELVENSIDAGAKNITVEIKKGGIEYIRVTDNGCGMDPNDVRTAFLRHATSKIVTKQDLTSISTMGFRGEALASIAAVCKVELMTRREEDLSGVKYLIEGSQEISYSETGCPVGTTIIVRNIFFNTPARMKFLKKDVSEANSIASIVDKIALANPSVSIKFIRDGEIKLHTPGDGKVFSAIHAVYSKDFCNTLIPVEYTHDGITVTGYISKPHNAKNNRAYQNFFVNSRYIRSKICSLALEEAYKHSIMEGKVPACVLNIQIPFDVVDVNVHPTKIEVRFSDEKMIFNAIYFAVKSALEQVNSDKITEIKRLQPAIAELMDNSAPVDNVQHILSDNPIYSYNKQAPILPPLPVRQQQQQAVIAELDEAPTLIQREVVTPPKEEPETPALQYVTLNKYDNARMIGELFGTYILLQNENEFIIIDKHAAHERLLYEKLKKQKDVDTRQVLLSPIVVSLTREEYTAIMDNLSVMEQLHITVDNFGLDTIVVREIPMDVPKEHVEDIIVEIACKLINHKSNITIDMLDDLYHSVACRSAIKAHDKTSLLELSKLIEMLNADESIKYCPHGRPIFVTLLKSEIEKMFGRIQ